MRVGAEPDDFCHSVIQSQLTRCTPLLDSSDASLHHVLGLMCFNGWNRCKQFLVIGEDVAMNVVCIEDDGDILEVQDKLDCLEHRDLWNTAHVRNGCRRYAVNCNDLCPVIQIRLEPLQSMFFTRNQQRRTSSRMSWPTVSNAALRSSRTRQMTLPSSAA